MLHIVIGTRAQLIKMAPVLRELESRRIPFRFWMTGQHHATMAELVDEFEIAASPEYLYSGREVKSLKQVVPWALHVLGEMRKRRKRGLRETDKRDVFVVHGDTFSTWLGMHMGRREGAVVAHVESGLRSFNWRNPFPEELVRMRVMRRCDIAFAPGDWAASNLVGYPARIVNTFGNTLVDTLRFAVEKGRITAGQRGGALFSIHRFETLYSAARSRLIVDFAIELSRETPVTFVLHPATEKRFRDIGLLGRLEEANGVTLLPRMTYLPFIARVASSQLVVTDGGSNQEELSYLGIPTLLMRTSTERIEGIGANVLLGKFDRQLMAEFAASALRQKPADALQLPGFEPSRQIVDELRNLISDDVSSDRHGAER